MPENLLVIDDEKGIVALCDRLLSRAGFTVKTATDPEDGLNILDNESFDLLLVDIRMPKMDGLEAIGNIIDINNKIPIIINSAYSNYKDDFMSWAADAYVVKSSNLDDLKNTIKKVLKKKKTSA